MTFDKQSVACFVTALKEHRMSIESKPNRSGVEQQSNQSQIEVESLVVTTASQKQQLLKIWYNYYTNAKIPRRSSPKLPHPIFFPTRKFGPTISTFDVDVVTGLLVPALDAGTAGDPVFTAAILALKYSANYFT